MRDEPWLQDPVDRLLARTGRQLAVDIGANHGTWTALFLPLFARVIAVEPDPRCAPIPGADFYRCLVGPVSGLVTLWLSDRPEQNHASPVHPLHGSSGRPEQFPQITLEKLCGKDAPDLVKIDVEGAEDGILAGVSDPARFARTAFIIESHARESELTAILHRWGRPFEIIPHPDICPDHCWLAVPPMP